MLTVKVNGIVDEDGSYPTVSGELGFGVADVAPKVPLTAPDKITLAEIYRFFDGAIALQPCVSQKFYGKCDDCPDERLCDLKPAFYEVREKTYQVMSGITLETLLQGRRRAGTRAAR